MELIIPTVEDIINQERKRSVDKARRWQQNNPDKYRSGYMRSNAKRSMKRASVTIAEYEAMFIAQNGRCAICGKCETRKMRGKPMRLAVDHDHETGIIRGLLCITCNTAIGSFNDDIELIQNAINYIVEHKRRP